MDTPTKRYDCIEWLKRFVPTYWHFDQPDPVATDPEARRKDREVRTKQAIALHMALAVPGAPEHLTPDELTQVQWLKDWEIRNGYEPVL